MTAGLQLGNLDMTSQQAGRMQRGMPGGEGGQQGSSQQFVREPPDRTRQERPQPAAPITVNNEVNVEINGDADADEVREGVEAGNEDLERRMQRVLNEEHRTGF